MARGLGPLITAPRVDAAAARWTGTAAKLSAAGGLEGGGAAVNGRATTLAGRFDDKCGGDNNRHGMTSRLTPAQISDLVPFLETLQVRPIARREPPELTGPAFLTTLRQVTSSEPGPAAPRGEFRLDPVRHRALLWRRLPWMLLFTAVVLAGFLLLAGHLGRNTPTSPSPRFLLTSGILIMAFMVVTTIRAGSRTLKSYRLRLEPDELAIEVAGLTAQRIHRTEVIEVRERRGGLEIVRRRGLPAGVPSSLDGFDEVKRALMAWPPGPAPPRKPMSGTTFGVAGTAAVLASFVLAPLSGVAKTPALSFFLAGVAAASFVACWWLFRLLPFRHSALVRGYFLFAAASVVMLNVLRWTVLPR